MKCSVRVKLLVFAACLGTAAHAVKDVAQSRASDQGQVAFVRNWDIWVIRPDGSGGKQLTDTPDCDCLPAWSWDGKALAFVRFVGEYERFEERPAEIWMTAPQGEGQRRVATHGRREFPHEFRRAYRLLFSPGGKRLVVQEDEGYPAEPLYGIYRADDGRRLGSTSLKAVWDWWPWRCPLTGEVIFSACSSREIYPQFGLFGVFAESRGLGEPTVWAMGEDGSHLRPLLAGSTPSWSPDGTGVVFIKDDAVWVADRDGQNAQRIAAELGLDKGAPEEPYIVSPVRFASPVWGGVPRLFRASASLLRGVKLDCIEFVAQADFKGTGQPQLFLAEQSGWMGPSQGVIVDPQGQWLHSLHGEDFPGTIFGWAEVGDFNEDGKPDIASEWPWGGSIGTTSFLIQTWTRHAFEPIFTLDDCMAETKFDDMDGDGTPEIIHWYMDSDDLEEEAQDSRLLRPGLPDLRARTRVDVYSYRDGAWHIENERFPLPMAELTVRHYMQLPGEDRDRAWLRGAVDAGERLVRRALAAGVSDPELHNCAGVIFAYDRELSAAVEELAKAVTLRPDEARFHFNLGVVYFAMGRFEQAAAEFRHTMQLRKDHPEDHDCLGMIHLEHGRAQEAIAEFRRAVELDSEDARYQYHLGLAYQRLGDQVEAQGHYRKASSLYLPYDLLAQVALKHPTATEPERVIRALTEAVDGGSYSVPNAYPLFTHSWNRTKAYMKFNDWFWEAPPLELQQVEVSEGPTKSRVTGTLVAKTEGDEGQTIWRQGPVAACFNLVREDMEWRITDYTLKTAIP